MMKPTSRQPTGRAIYTQKSHKQAIQTQGARAIYTQKSHKQDIPARCIRLWSVRLRSVQFQCWPQFLSADRWALAPTGLLLTIMPQHFIDPLSLGGILLEPPSWTSWITSLLVPVLVLSVLAVMFLLRTNRPLPPTEPGFEVISQTEQRRFIPIGKKHCQLDFIANLETDNPLRLSANLNRVSLSIRRFGYLLEDKNYRNALLVNRRRQRRTLLRDGDTLDLGDLTLLYRDPRDDSAQSERTATPSAQVVIRFKRTRGPIRKGTPYLISEQYPNRIFYITKNMVYLGRSENNDLVVKAPGIQYRHAKIERVGGRLKLSDITIVGNTYVNNRRVEQRFLKEGDLISLEKERFKYQVAPTTVRNRQPSQQGPARDTPTGNEDQEASYLEEAPTG